MQALRWKAGFSSIKQQLDEPGRFMRAVSAQCPGRLCGAVIMPYQLPQSSLPRLFVPDCKVRALVLARRNRTAEYADFREHASRSRGGNQSQAADTWARMPYTTFASMSEAWYGRVNTLTARSPTFRLSAEALYAEVGGGGARGPRGGASARLAVLFNRLLDKQDHGDPQPPAGETHATNGEVKMTATDTALAAPARTPGVAATAGLSAAGAKATLSAEHAASMYRERRRRIVVYTASAAFLATCLAGMCLALGIAIGQRSPRAEDMERVAMLERIAMASGRSPLSTPHSPRTPNVNGCHA